ncbi:SRPBCC family protein [Corynebacterium halotolerans]|uniref:Coenzyme Q-binding protein COQ10 START domain-containing protein n=1 Tax=Corynebacterium halotolerans YIM 70093 = DSM 44683 TaxID=1121362 RepID=M1NX29_9CORY|nr:SRPBCC family protein [Corynebacterium halotolerans]AGF72040.1 hypothetical protein A605_05170 [Corynebacterium halotolerans YIM 70093 = DSM 44683]
MAHRHTLARQGESAPFHFETTWRVPAEAEQVWRVLSDVSSWPDWWPGMRTARMRGSGDRASLMVQSPLGYRLRFAIALLSSEPPTSAELTVDGDLRGEGSFTAHQDADGTRLTITWCVVTRRRLIGAVRPVATWAHDAVMAAGQRGLRRACERSSNRSRLPASGAAVSSKVLGGVLVLVSGGLIGGRLLRARRERAAAGQPEELPVGA